MNIEELRLALLANGADLRPAADLGELSRFEAQQGIKLSGIFRRLHSDFDGFASNHFSSQICLWPLKRITENLNLRTQVDNQMYFPIGDLLVDSDFLMSSLEDDNKPVFLLYERRKLAESLQTFLQKFLSGTFNFQ